jgi:hypothetical protein
MLHKCLTKPNVHSLLHGARCLLVVLLLGLESGLRNAVQVTLAGLGDAATTLVLVDLNDADLRERLEDLAVNGAGSVDVVGGAGAAVLGGTVSISNYSCAWD